MAGAFLSDARQAVIFKKGKKSGGSILGKDWRRGQK